MTHVKVRTQIKYNCQQLSWVWTRSRLLTYLLLITIQCTAFVSHPLVTGSPLHNARSPQQCPVSICAGAWRQAGVTSPEGAVSQVCVSWKQKMTIMRSDIDTLIQHEPLPAGRWEQSGTRKIVGYWVNCSCYLRVWTEGSADNKERNLVEMDPPETSVIASSIQVPDVEALGQRQPRAEVLGVVHRAAPRH